MRTIFVSMCLLVLCLFACTENKKKAEVSEIKTAEKVSVLPAEVSLVTQLEKQLKQGYSGEVSETDYFEYQQYSNEDLMASVPILEQHLKESGFRFPTSQEFKQKIRNVFGKTQNPAVHESFTYLSTGSCDQLKKIRRNEMEGGYGFDLFAVSKGSFITAFYAIPELIDYKKQYPQLAEKEKHFNKNIKDQTHDLIVLYLWNDFSELPKQRAQNLQTFVARNKYLFNEDKAALEWLIKEDEPFLMMLYEKFNYDQEFSINKAIINGFGRKQEGSDKERVGAVFGKNCQSELIIRKGMLNTYAELFNEKKVAKVLRPVWNYSSDLIAHKHDGLFNESERIKMIAHLANLYDPLFKKHHHDEGQDWFLMTILADYRDFLGDQDWGRVKEIFRKNNYYGLPHLKEMVDYAEQFDRLGAPD